METGSSDFPFVPIGAVAFGLENAMTERRRTRPRKKTRNDFSFWVGEILRIRWEDIGGWEEVTKKETEKDVPLLFDNFGRCISETKTTLILCSMAPVDSKDKHLREVTRIPKRSINQIDILYLGGEI